MPRTPQKPAISANAADQTAQTVVVPEHTALQPVDHASFFTALDTPPAPTDRMRAAFARHCETITSR